MQSNRWENLPKVAQWKPQSQEGQQVLFQTDLHQHVEHKAGSAVTTSKLACGAKHPEELSQTSSFFSGQENSFQDGLLPQLAFLFRHPTGLRKRKRCVFFFEKTFESFICKVEGWCLWKLHLTTLAEHIFAQAARRVQNRTKRVAMALWKSLLFLPRVRVGKSHQGVGWWLSHGHWRAASSLGHLGILSRNESTETSWFYKMVQCRYKLVYNSHQL